MAFFRLKSFLLLFDSAALAWLLTRLFERPLLPLSGFPWLHILPFLGLAALGAITDLAFLVLRFRGWLLRRDTPYQPYGRSVAVTQLALTAGMFLGTLLAAGYPQVAGHLLVVIGLGGALSLSLVSPSLNSLFQLPGCKTELSLAWTALFFELFLAGAIMSAQPELTPPFTRFFMAAILFTPLWSTALFFGLKNWLLHPFGLRDLFEERLSGRSRGSLLAVALTAFVPMGGIAIPFWIYAQHRIWPKSEGLLWKLKLVEQPAEIFAGTLKKFDEFNVPERRETPSS